MFVFARLNYFTFTTYIRDFLQSKDIEVGNSGVSDMVSNVDKYLTESQHIHDQQVRMNKVLKLSIDINHLFLKSNDQQSVYDFILKNAIEAIGKTDKGTILLLNQEGHLVPISIQGFDDSFKSIKIKKEHDFLYIKTKGRVDHSIIIDDVVEFNRLHMTEQAFIEFYEKFPKIKQTVLSTPIRVDGEFIGAINIDSYEQNVFNSDDQYIMDLFASQLEVAIRNRKLLDEILFLSRYDNLTGVYNRKHFDEIINTLINRGIEFVYIIIDMNDLKLVNDGYGHHEGDKQLKIFTKVVRDNIRNTDYMARLGGDEFAVVLTSSDKMMASKIFLRIMKELDLYSTAVKLPYKISFSYGISSFPQDAKSAEELYLESDKKMYQMKRAHKDLRN